MPIKTAPAKIKISNNLIKCFLKFKFALKKIIPIIKASQALREKVRRITLGPYVGIGISSGPFQVGFGAQYNLRWSDVKTSLNIFKKKEK